MGRSIKVINTSGNPNNKFKFLFKYIFISPYPFFFLNKDRRQLN